jgi:hypothetical protein
VDYFIVYTHQHKGYVAAIGRRYKYTKSEERKTLCGKLVKIMEPENRIVVSMEDIQAHYKTIQVCSNNCKIVNGKLQHSNHHSEIFLALKMI